jgi:hypothetical protein
MRILIAAPRKAGNAHLRCLLATSYGLVAADPREAPASSDLQQVDAWLSEFPTGSVVNTDFAYAPELAEAARRHDVTLVSILRHPFDLFVSTHDVAQQRAARDRRGVEAAWQPLVGTALDDPAVLAYASDGFAQEVRWLTDWHESGEASIRFEQLEQDPAAALAGLSQALRALDASEIARAVALCPADNVVHSRPGRGRRMPPLPAGAWRERLPAATLQLLQERYGETVTRLGYEVN